MLLSWYQLSWFYLWFILFIASFSKLDFIFYLIFMYNARNNYIQTASSYFKQFPYEWNI